MTVIIEIIVGIRFLVKYMFLRHHFLVKKLSNFPGSIVNFINGSKLFKTFSKALRSGAECHGRKPSSIYCLNNCSISF